MLFGRWTDDFFKYIFTSWYTYLYYLLIHTINEQGNPGGRRGVSGVGWLGSGQQVEQEGTGLIQRKEERAVALSTFLHYYKLFSLLLHMSIPYQGSVCLDNISHMVLFHHYWDRLFKYLGPLSRCRLAQKSRRRWRYIRTDRSIQWDLHVTYILSVNRRATRIYWRLAQCHHHSPCPLLVFGRFYSPG